MKYRSLLLTILWVGLQLLTAAPAHAQDVGTQTPTEPGEFILVEQTQRLILLPETLPPSTTRANIDRVQKAPDAGTDDYLGDHVEVVWEPTSNAPLAKAVTLSPGTWRVSFFSNPLQHPTNAFADTSWSYFVSGGSKETVAACNTSDAGPGTSPCIQKGNNNFPFGDKSRLVACAFRKVGSDAQKGLPPSNCTFDSTLWAPGWTQVKIWATTEALLSPQQLLTRFGQRGEAETPLPSAPRSFATGAADVTSELFQAVADVALERLEIAALESVREKLLKSLCDLSIESLVKQAFAEARWQDGSTPPRLLPRTCNMLQRVRLQELATASAGLQLALKQDLAAFGATLLTVPLGQALHPMGNRGNTAGTILLLDSSQRLAPIIGGVALLLQLALEPESSGASLATAQLVVRQFVDAIRQDLLLHAGDIGASGQSRVLRGGLVIAATTIAACHASGNCDSHAIRRYIEHPEQFFKLLGGDAPLAMMGIADDPAYVALQGRLVSIATKAISVMSPRSQQDSRYAAVEASAMVFEMLELMVDANEDSPQERTRRKRELQTYREMSDALLHQDFSLALVTAGGIAVARLAEQPAATFDRKIRYASAFANYLQSYPSLNALGGSAPGLSLEEQRRLRRQAINTLVDLASDRSQKVGDWTTSLTVTPGARFFRWSSTRLKKWPSGVHLSLPLGVSVEHVVSERVGVGFHGFAFDLGQYAAVNLENAPQAQDDGTKAESTTPKPMTALAPGLGFGVSYRNWTAMIDARYAPQWNFNDGAERRNVSFGLTLGFQVPLLNIH